MIEPIRGKVIKIIDQYRVILNVGEGARVKPDMRFIIYDEGDEISDPTNGKSLGKLELVKATVRVEHVQPEFCIAGTIPVSYSYTLDIFSAMQAVTTMRRSERKPLPVDEKDITPLFTKGADKIRVGDLVRSLSEQG